MNRSTQRITGLLTVAALSLSVWFVSGDASEVQKSDNALHVLFIGNSLTYSNDLPSIVRAFANADTQKPLDFKAVVFGGFSLEDHWGQGNSRTEIGKGGWEFVVLQQGPSASPEGRRYLIDYAQRFDREIRRVGATPALYMVWPFANRLQDFDGVSESYSLAAREVKGLLLPAGDSWRIASMLDPKLELYSADGLHPTLTGSYLAGLVIYGQLYKRSPMGLPSTLTLRSGIRIEIPAERARVLQEAATKAIKGLAKP